MKAFVLCLLLALCRESIQSCWDDVSSPTHCRAEACPTLTNVKFQLYTNKNPFAAFPLLLGNEESVKKSTFSKDYPTAIYIHGYIDPLIPSGADTIRNEYVKHNTPYNVIVVDWSALAASLCPDSSCSSLEASMSQFDVPKLNNITKNESKAEPYLIASCNAIVVGKHVSDMIQFLMSYGYTDFGKLHIIGHSLGAHVAGVAGHHLKSGTGKAVARITGLDPANKLFSEYSLVNRLDQDDAEFVDVIHTEGEEIGTLEPSGHVDFYPNNGTHPQPGCALSDEYGWFCSHSRAHKYFAESINNPYAFKSCPCDDSAKCDRCLEQDDDPTAASFIYMGTLAPRMPTKLKHRRYHLETKSSSPFGKACGEQRETSKGYEWHLVSADSMAPHFPNMHSYITVMDLETKVPVYSLSTISRMNAVDNTVGVVPLDFKIHKKCSNISISQTSCEIPEGDPSFQIDDLNPKFAYDRGHLTSLSQFQFDWTESAAQSTNLCTNIVPQEIYTHRCAWNQVENRILRSFENIQGAGYVISGTSVEGSTEINNGGSWVPDSVFKLVCYKDEGTTFVVGFLADNSLFKGTTPAEIEAEQLTRRTEANSPRTRKEVEEKTGRGDDLRTAWSKANWELLRTGHTDDFPDPMECATAAFASKWVQSKSRSGEAEECKCTAGESCPVDDTIKQCSSGENVVFATLRLLQKSNIFQHDYQLLFRVAHVLSNFGEYWPAGVTNCSGGIWQISEANFQATKSGSAAIGNEIIKINQQFGIQWSNVIYEDLQKPLFSAIAARLLILTKGWRLESTISKQTTTYRSIYPQSQEDYDAKVRNFYTNNPAHGRYDLITVLDGSGSIGTIDYEKAKSSVAQFLAPFGETGSQVRVGLVLFSSTATPRIELNNTQTPDQLESTILKMSYPGGGTSTDLAITSATKMFNTYIMDPPIPSVSIILTDGQSGNPQRTAVAAAEAYARGIFTFAVGITSGPNVAELEIIAGNHTERVFMLEGFDDLKEISLWLNVEANTIPIVQPIDTPFEDTLEDGSKRYFEYELPSDGLTLELVPISGTVRGYYASDFETPGAAYHEGVLVKGLNHIKNNGKSSSRIYVMLEPFRGESQYLVEGHTGIIEGCGLKGERATHFKLQPTFEVVDVGTLIFDYELYQSVSFGQSTLDSKYIEYVVNQNRLQILTKPRWSNFIKESGELVMNGSLSMSCSNGSSITYTFEIPVYDENNQIPKFKFPTLNPVINVDIVELGEPLSFVGGGQLEISDEDFEEFHAAVKIESDDPSLQVDVIHLWTGEHPDIYKYNVSLHFVTQPDSGSRVVTLTANDGVNVAWFKFTLNV